MELLKIGDKIRYKLPLPNNPTSHKYFSIAYPAEGTGVIKEIVDEYVVLDNNHKFYKQYIVSKLEPITEYKEIKIEQSPKIYICNNCENKFHNHEIHGGICAKCEEKQQYVAWCSKCKKTFLLDERVNKDNIYTCKNCCDKEKTITVFDLKAGDTVEFSDVSISGEGKIVEKCDAGFILEKYGGEFFIHKNLIKCKVERIPVIKK